jgi:hypothetical protein
MMNPLSRIARVFHWTARTLSGIILMFWGFLIVAHLTGNAGSSSRTLTWADYVLMTGLALALLGLALGWVREKTGAIVCLCSISICALINWKVLLFPGTLLPFTAFLFLLSSWLRRPSLVAPQHGID